MKQSELLKNALIALVVFIIVYVVLDATELHHPALVALAIGIVAFLVGVPRFRS